MMPPSTAVAMGCRKYYVAGRGVTDVGERKCALDGCNALEFRTSGYCLRHKDGAPGVEDPESTPRTYSLLIPSIALTYVPFVITVMMFYSYSYPDEILPGFEFFILSSMCLVPLLPIYAFYLFKIIRRRRGHKTLTTPVVIFYIISFLVPFLWLLMYAWFATNFNGIV